MTAPLAGDASERRADDLLLFDVEERSLRLGGRTCVVERSGGNDAVLRAFVDLVGDSRGVRPTDLVEVRESDLDALSEALDLDATDLRDQLQAVLGLSRVVSRQLITRLRQRHVLRGVAATAAGLAVVGGLAVAAAAGPAEMRSGATSTGSSVRVGEPAAVQPLDVEQPVVDGPLVEDENGVGLIPPIEVDADGTVLIPAISVDQDPDAPTG